MRPRLRHVVVIVALAALGVMIAYGMRLITASRRAGINGTLSSRQASQAEEMLLQTAKAKQLRCPESTGAILKPSSKTGHHKVILTWNASVPSTDPLRQAVGYCLYRIAAKNNAMRAEKCKNCEQVNRKPIESTACIDDLVEDGEKYYYVAMAINANGDTSVLSNDTPAKIPSSPKVKHAQPLPTYPLCRAGNDSH